MEQEDSGELWVTCCQGFPDCPARARSSASTSLKTQAPALRAPSGPEVNTEQLLDLSRSVYSALGSQQGAVERLRNHSPVGNWAERHSLPWLNMPYWGLTMAGHEIEIEIEIKVKSNYEK